MPEIKVCGITTDADIDILNEAKPEYAGFVFAPSKRQVSIHQVQVLTKNLDPKIKKVGVFVNESIANVIDVANKCRLDVLQFHGDESPQYCNCFNQQVWKSIRIRDEKCLDQGLCYDVDAILLDAFHPKLYGGSGITFDWNLIKDFSSQKKIIMAGGLSEENVQSCIRMTRPHIVDVSSGVETEGKKDAMKVIQFIKKVREYDA